LGGSKTIHVDVRVIAATNKDLPKSIKNGSFRDDLYFRLGGSFSIRVPSLRERKEDIPMLVAHFCPDIREGKKHLSDEAFKKLLLHDWPGNVRELKDYIKRAISRAKGPVIEVTDIHVSRPEKEGLPNMQISEEQIIVEALETSERVEDAWPKTGWSRSMFFEKCRKHRIRPKRHLKGCG
jgi:DNA-binding NtrC family response regulator